MVGPGTGVAPMRSVVLERRRQREERKKKGASPAAEDAAEGKRVERPRGFPSPDTLFFGCRCDEMPRCDTRRLIVVLIALLVCACL